MSTDGGTDVDEPPREAGDSSSEPAPDGDAPSWWHRGHPVFTPLAGFFTGLVTVIAVPGAFGALLSVFFDNGTAEKLFPFVLVIVVIPLALLAVPRTRTFGRYMLIGMVATAIVVIGVAALTLWILVATDG